MIAKYVGFIFALNKLTYRFRLLYLVNKIYAQLEILSSLKYHHDLLFKSIWTKFMRTQKWGEILGHSFIKDFNLFFFYLSIYSYLLSVFSLAMISDRHVPQHHEGLRYAGSL